MTTDGRMSTVERLSFLTQRQRARGTKRAKATMKTIELGGKTVSFTRESDGETGAHAARSGFLVGRPPVRE